MGVMQERRWLLERHWGQGGWRPMHGFEGGVKKWEGHRSWLLKNGYLVQDHNFKDHQMITAKGLAWLSEPT